MATRQQAQPPAGARSHLRGRQCLGRQQARRRLQPQAPGGLVWQLALCEEQKGHPGYSQRLQVGRSSGGGMAARRVEACPHVHPR